MESDRRMTTFELTKQLKKERAETIRELSKEYDPTLVEWMFEIVAALLNEPMTNLMDIRNVFAAGSDLGKIAADMTINHMSQISISTLEEEVGMFDE